MDDVLKAPPQEAITKLYTYLATDLANLQSLDSLPLADTPLHSAANEGRTDLVLEIQQLMPSFGRKLNLHGDSPLHLALRGGYANTVSAMVKLDPQLVRIQGKEGITPLHYVAEKGYLELLAKFLKICPGSIETLTNRKETAVHVAVKNEQTAAVKLLLGWLKRSNRKKVLARKDWEGSTILHVAASSGNPEIIKLLAEEVSGVTINKKNSKGLTALDIATSCQANDATLQILRQKKAKLGSSIPDEDSKNTFVEYLSSPMTMGERMIKFNAHFEKGLSSQTRDSILVVAILIVTATFQTSLSPPGGFSNETQSPVVTNATTITANGSNVTSTAHEDGKVAMSNGFFVALTFFNSIALAASLGTIFLALPISPCAFLIFVSLVFLMISYVVGVLVITPQSHRYGIAAIMMGCYIGFIMVGYVKTDLFAMLNRSRLSKRKRMRFDIRRNRALVFYLDDYSKRSMD